MQRLKAKQHMAASQTALPPAANPPSGPSPPSVRASGPPPPSAGAAGPVSSSGRERKDSTLSTLRTLELRSPAGPSPPPRPCCARPGAAALARELRDIANTRTEPREALACRPEGERAPASAPLVLLGGQADSPARPERASGSGRLAAEAEAPLTPGSADAVVTDTGLRGRKCERRALRATRQLQNRAQLNNNRAGLASGLRQMREA
jgi:hypothetical protein